MLAANAARAQSQTTPEVEYKKLIRVSEDIQPLGENPFGENISLYDGSLSFEQTDVSLAGNGPALSLSRQFHLPDQQDRTDMLDNAFGNWDLDLPRITTMTPNQFNASGWLDRSGGKRVCDAFGAPPSIMPAKGGNLPWEIAQWWHGIQLIVPGDGRQDLLQRGTDNPLTPQMSGMSFPIVTKQNWMISCLAQAKNDASYQAFLAVAPDGTKYWFDHLAYRWAPTISRAPGDVLNRREGMMLVTRIEDRFGNHLDYGYDASDRLTGITASDGRVLGVQYSDSSPLVRSITLQATDADSRTWTYGYTAESGDWPGTVELTSVTLPDASRWTFDLTSLTNHAWVDLSDTPSICNAVAIPNNLNSSYTGTIIHPSGLTGTFTVKPVKRGRSYVFRDCWSGTGGGTTPTSPDTFSRTPDAWYAMAITQRRYTGAGLTSQRWTYGYSPSNESWSQDSCAGAGTCATTVWTDEMDPAGNGTRRTFSNRYDVSESSLVRTD